MPYLLRSIFLLTLLLPAPTWTQFTSLTPQSWGTTPMMVPQWQCPDYSLPMNSMMPCDPDLKLTRKPSTNSSPKCPKHSKCRATLLLAPPVGFLAYSQRPIIMDGTEVKYLCCDSSHMAIGEWLIESGLAPQVVAHVPQWSLAKVTMRDSYKKGNSWVESSLLDISEIGEEVLSPIDNEPSGQRITYHALHAVEFREVPEQGSFLHFIVAIDQLSNPSALYALYDYPSFGQQVYNLTEQNARYQRGYSEVIGGTRIPQQTAYTHQYVVLVFKTAEPIGLNRPEVDDEIASSYGKLPRLLLAGDDFGLKLGKPTFGFMFYLTTPSTIFQIEGSTASSQQPGSETRKGSAAGKFTALRMLTMLLVLLHFFFQ